tara:strand:+ start:2630 stop:2872 length:243 start_codon:yes stop_codon:yes gene_type:complete
MKFKQFEDGSCDIIFDKNEVKIIKEKNKIHLSDVGLRHFGNNLVKIVAEWNAFFKKETSELTTTPRTSIKGEKPKDVSSK